MELIIFLIFSVIYLSIGYYFGSRSEKIELPSKLRKLKRVLRKKAVNVSSFPTYEEDLKEQVPSIIVKLRNEHKSKTR